MNNSPTNQHGDAELTALIEAVLNEQADDTQFAELERRLQNDAAARDTYATYVNLHCELTARFAVEGDIVGFEAELEAEFREGELADFRQAVAGGALLDAAVRTDRRRFLRRVSMMTTVVTLIIVGCFAAAQRWPWLIGREPVAVLHAADHCRWRDAETRLVGDEFHSGQTLHLMAGVAEIQFASGATVVLQGPATLQLESQRQARLQSGSLSVLVPPHSVGFTIDAPGVKVVDLGTRFGVIASPHGVTDVHMFQGQVEASLVDRQGDSLQTVSLAKSQAAIIDPAKFTLTRTAAALDLFAFDVALLKQIATFTEEAEQFAGHSDPERFDAQWQAYNPPHYGFQTASEGRFVQMIRPESSSLTSISPSDSNAEIENDRTIRQDVTYAAFEGPWLSYDFSISTSGSYRLWIRGAGYGSGPDGRADWVEATAAAYRSPAFLGSQAIRPRAMNLNQLVGVWQFGDSPPLDENSVEPIVIGSRFLDQPIPDGATKLFLGSHDATTWNDNTGQVTAHVIWATQSGDSPQERTIVVDADDCLAFSWATDEQLTAAAGGRGPNRDHPSRPKALDVPPTAHRVSITAQGDWSHVGRDEFIGLVAVKLYRLDDSEGESEVELLSAANVTIPRGREFQWTRVDFGSEQALLPAATYRLRVYAKGPGVAIDQWLLQAASLPDPTGE